jgi:hypothetical protein
MLTPFRYFAATVFFLSLASVANAQGTGNPGSTGGTSGIGGSMAGIGGTGMSTGTGATSGTGGTNGGIGGTTATGGAATDVSTLGSNAAQSFIGANATQGFIGGATGTNNQQRTNRQFRALQNNNQQQTQQTTGTPRAIKTTLRVGFVFPSAPQLASVGRMANANVASMNRFVAQRPDLAGINVDLNSSGVAVLTGSAVTEESRRLAANLMRIQPGVRKIDNQIVVQAE